MNSQYLACSAAQVPGRHELGDLCLANAQLVLPNKVVIGALIIEQGVFNGIV